MKRIALLLSGLLVALFTAGCAAPRPMGPQETDFFGPPSGGDPPAGFLGPQSNRARGELRVLVAVARFPDVQPRVPLGRIEKTVAADLDGYVREQSYGQARVKAEFLGYVPLPEPLSAYRVSPNNFEVDRRRVRKLVEDTLSAIEGKADPAAYQHLLIVPAAMTTPGKGYGMMCYCANPGMLTGVRGSPRYVTLRSKGGGVFSGGVFVGTENAPLGMFAHDFFHALGGVHGSQRLVPCLYNFERQAEASRRHEWEYCTDYLGAWDVMSAHYLGKDSTPGISSFTRIRLGWVSPEQVVWVRPGGEKGVFLAPLARGGTPLAVKIPLPGGQYYLIENRQPVGADQLQPDSGLLILRVDPAALEGSGTVRVMDADPRAPNLSRATFRLDQENRNLFLDRIHSIAVVPLWMQGESHGVMVTRAEKGQDALKAAQVIRKLWQRYPEPREGKTKNLAEECLAAFQRFDFSTSLQIGQKGL